MASFVDAPPTPAALGRELGREEAEVRVEVGRACLIAGEGGVGRKDSRIRRRGWCRATRSRENRPQGSEPSLQPCRSCIHI